MNYTLVKKLPSFQDMQQAFPLSLEARAQIKQNTAEVRAILEGRDDRLLIIVGPCSAWPKEAVLDYARRLVNLNHQVKARLKLVMRVYTQKPRTTKGWTGPINQPDPCAPPNIEAGLTYTLEMMVKVLELGLPLADEAVLTPHAQGLLSYLSWVAIGARSSEDQAHRILASAIDCAVGLKNPTHGSLAVAVNSIVAAQHSHAAAFDGYQVQTQGNLHAHLVLRGANQASNYSIEDLESVQRQMQKHGIQNPSVIVDASHDNCLLKGKKAHQLQPDIVFEIMQNVAKRADLKKLIKGFMIESFLKEGSQALNSNDLPSLDLNGLSITDPCLGWEATETFLLDLARMHS